MPRSIRTALAAALLCSAIVIAALALWGQRPTDDAAWRPVGCVSLVDVHWWWTAHPHPPANEGTPGHDGRVTPRCTHRPSDYRRQLEWAARAEGTTLGAWAADVLGYVDLVLFAQDRPPYPRLVTWLPGDTPPLVVDGYVRLDGAIGRLGRPPVPTYLFLPDVPTETTFRPRGAVIVIHGHDRGREQVVAYPDKYQKAMAARLAAEGYVVLAADNVSFGRHDPQGDGRGLHDKDWRSYLRSDRANGLISYTLADLTDAVTFLTHLRVAPDATLGRYRPATLWEDGSVEATSGVGVTGLSYGAELSAYMLIDPRPVGYVIASGLIDTCDVLMNDHHRCQLVRPFEGMVALWDLVIAGASAERPAFGRPACRPRIQVQQGSKDKILRGWGKRGLVELRRAARELHLDNLEVVEWSDAGHEYLVKPAIEFWRKVFSPAGPGSAPRAAKPR